MVQNGGHTWTSIGHSFFCIRCTARVHSTQFAQMLSVQPAPLCSDFDGMWRAVREGDQRWPLVLHDLDYAPPTYGKATLHESHRLRYNRGIVFCDKCGYYTQGNRTDNLRDPCKGRTTSAPVKSRLLRMQGGDHPINNGKWPLETYKAVIMPHIMEHLDSIVSVCTAARHNSPS